MFKHDDTLGVNETISCIENKITSGVYQFSVPNSMFGSILVKEDGENYNIFNPTSVKRGKKTDWVLIIPFCKYPVARHYYIIEGVMKIALVSSIGYIDDGYPTALAVTYLREVEDSFYPYDILASELRTNMGLFAQFDRTVLECTIRNFYHIWKEASTIAKQAKTMSVGSTDGCTYPELTQVLRGLIVMHRNNETKDSRDEIMSLLKAI